MKTVAIIGAGQRGQDIYANFIKNHSEMVKVVAVVEPNYFRRETLVREHNIPQENIFTNWDDFFKREKLADLAIISTLDRLHYEPTMKALDKGYNILLEKPMSVNKDECRDMVNKAEEKGFKVIIAGAGMAAHLPGMCAAIFPMPVIGIPMHTTSLGGRDSLYSIVQMPTGIPVATVAINGGANAGLLAAKILATSDAALLDRLKAYSQGLKESVQKKDQKLQEVGYKNYGK